LPFLGRAQRRLIRTPNASLVSPSDKHWDSKCDGGYPNGKGRPENANITGLTYEYFIEQMVDFRNGASKTSDPRKANTGLMTRFAKTMTDEEIKLAAQYFTGHTPRRPHCLAGHVDGVSGLVAAVSRPLAGCASD
jgi:hypothetical protein